MDAYGEELYIVTMTAGKDQTKAADSSAFKNGPDQGVGVFSAGPDKDPSTWEDNLTSWETSQKIR